jgi:hypothetical protein
MTTAYQVKADKDGRIRIDRPGHSFMLELDEGLPSERLIALPNGQETGKTDFFEDRIFTMGPLNSLEITGAAKNNLYTAWVAKDDQELRRAPRTRPVRLAHLRREGTVILPGGNSYSLVSDLAENATVWTDVIDVRTFSHLAWRVTQGGNIAGATSVVLEVFHADSNGAELPRAGRMFSVNLPSEPAQDFGLTMAQFGYHLPDVESANFLSRNVLLGFVSGRLTVNTAVEQDPVTFFNGLTAELLAWKRT